MAKSDSSKEEGEISDEDDITTGSKKFGLLGDEPILPVLQHAKHIPSYTNKIIGNKKSQQRRQRNRRGANYSKTKNQMGKASDDFHILISEYKDIRRRLDNLQGAEGTDENENIMKCSGTFSSFLDSEDHELLQLRMSALASEKKIGIKVLDSRQNVCPTSNQVNTDNMMDNYDVVHMEVESDRDDNDGRTGIITDISLLEEQIHQLKQKKMEISECQKQLKYHQNKLSGMTSPRALPLISHNQQPLYSIIQHNLQPHVSVRPLVSQKISLAMKMPTAGRGPLLPNPIMRGPLLTKPSLLPLPRGFAVNIPLQMPQTAVNLLSSSLKPFELPARSVNFNQPRENISQHMPWGLENACYSPRPIEVVSGTCRRDSKPFTTVNPSPSLSSDLSGSYSNTSIASSSTCSTGEGQSNKVSPDLYSNGTKAMDPLYEDFDDELHDSKCHQTEAKLCHTIPTLNKLHVPDSMSPPSCFLIPHCESLNEPSTSFEHINHFKTSCTQKIKDEKCDEAKDEDIYIDEKCDEAKDEDIYINTLKNKLLHDIELRKNKKVLKIDDNEKMVTSGGKYHDLPNQTGMGSRDAGNGDEEDFCDMVVIDSDHESSSPIKILDCPYALAQEYMKPNASFENMVECSEEASTIGDDSSDQARCMSSNISDDTKDEEMILRARLLKSLAARQIKQATEQVEQSRSTLDFGSEKGVVINGDGQKHSVSSLMNQNQKLISESKNSRSRIRRLRRNKFQSQNSGTLMASKSSSNLSLALQSCAVNVSRKVASSCSILPSSPGQNGMKILSSPASSPIDSKQERNNTSAIADKIPMLPKEPLTNLHDLNHSVYSSPAMNNASKATSGISAVSIDPKAKKQEDEIISAQFNSRTHLLQLPNKESKGMKGLQMPPQGLVKDNRVVHSGPSNTRRYSKMPPKTKFLNNEPIVILLSGDESEESGPESRITEECPLDDNMSNRLESLLREARKETSQMTSSISAANKISQNVSLTTFTELKADSKPSSSSGNSDIMSSNLSDKNKATNDDVNVSRKALHHSTRRDKLENLNKEELRRREKELEVSLLTHKLKQLKEKSSSESKSLQEQKSLLAKLESVLGKKRAELVTSESNVQKIREQLEAALKILNHNQLQVAELDKNREAMRSQILEKERKTLKTSNDITECQGKLLSVTKSLKSNLHLISSASDLRQITSARLSSSNLKLRQQSRNKRKLSFDVSNEDHPPSKRPTSEIPFPIQMKTSTSAASIPSTSDVSPRDSIFDSNSVQEGATINAEVNFETCRTSKRGTDLATSKTTPPSHPQKTLIRKSKTELKKHHPINIKDEKFLKIKDAHRKSTLRNHQPLSTITTQLSASAFSSAKKPLNFNFSIILKSKQSYNTGPMISNLSGEALKYEDSNFSKIKSLGEFLKSVRSFRTEQEFASLTHTNKMELNVPLCHFELLGKCNDDDCPWQHEKNFLMTPREILMEIVSYHPFIVPDMDEKTPYSKYKVIIGAFVDDFMSKSKQTDYKKLYLMMLHLVSQAKGSAIFTPLDHNRLWSVKQEKAPIKMKDSKTSGNLDDRTSFVLGVCPHMDDEDLLSGCDHRYWMMKLNGEGNFGDDNTINEDRGDDDDEKEHDGNSYQNCNSQSIDEETFLKKAYSILAVETRSKLTPKLDVALKVLAKGIEHYPQSVHLWQHYLKIFTQMRNQIAIKQLGTFNKPSSSKEATIENNVEDDFYENVSAQLRVAFKQALQMIPSFDIHWQFIQISDSFSNKMESCTLALNYLCGEKVCSVEDKVRSHWLLEVIMHKAQICFQTGKYSMGMDLVEDCLNSHDVYGLLSRMTLSDRIILWMCFLHLNIFHSLPMSLFSSVNDNGGIIVNKTPFSIIDHHLSISSKQFSTSNKNECTEILSWYDDAIASCLSYFFEPPSQGFLTFIQESGCLTGGEDQPSTLSSKMARNGEDEESWSWLGRLLISKANLLVEFKRNEDACCFLRSVMHLMPEYVQDVRVALLHIIINISHVTLAEFYEESKCVHECHSAKLTYHVAKLLVYKDQSEEALQVLERLPIKIHDSNSGKEDPNILYCKLLDLELPAGFIPPSYSGNFRKDSMEREKVYFWLCYCLLLDLQGDYDSAEDVYCKAVCRQKCSVDLGEIWLARLERLLSNYGQMITNEVQTEFFKLVEKSLNSLPIKLLLPLNENGGKTYDSYDVHNTIISFCTKLISPTASLTNFYNWTLSIMPGNARLAVEAINHFIKSNHRSLARGFIIMCLQEAPQSMALWKTSLRLALLEGNIEQVRADYKKSLENLPFQKKLWKDFMLFEMVNKREEDVNLIVKRCQQLGVNIVDLYKSLSAR